MTTAATYASGNFAFIEDSRKTTKQKFHPAGTPGNTKHHIQTSPTILETQSQTKCEIHGTTNRLERSGLGVATYRNYMPSLRRP